MSTLTYETELERLLAERLDQISTELDRCGDELERISVVYTKVCEAIEKAAPIVVAARELVERNDRFGFEPAFRKLAEAVRSAS